MLQQLTFANFLFWNFRTLISSSVELETGPIVCGRYVVETYQRKAEKISFHVNPKSIFVFTFFAGPLELCSSSAGLFDIV